MANKKPRLPNRAEDAWAGAPFVDPPQSLCDVSGAGGLVFAGGAGLLMLRPGAERWQSRAPEDLGAVIAVAAEQGPPWRYAVSSSGGVTVYGLPDDQKLTLRASVPEIHATHLAWAVFGEDRVLYLRWNDGSVGRVRDDLQTVENLDVDPMDAIASDVNGALAMVAVCCGAEDAHALVSHDGIRFEERPVTATVADAQPEPRVYLAVAGEAVAYSAEGFGTHVSRGIDDDFVPYEALSHGGPVAFHGSRADAAVFGMSWSKLLCAIERVDAEGEARRIVEMEAVGGDAPKLAGLQWDQSRRVLWAVSLQMGLFRSDEPTGKRGKPRSLN